MSGQNIILVSSAVLWSVVAALIYRRCITSQEILLPSYFNGLLILVCTFWAAVAVRIATLPACRYTPATILVLQYVLDCIMSALGSYFSWQFEKQTMNYQEVQERFLIDLLWKQTGTAYGQDKEFLNVTSSSEFRAKHPLTLHRDYEQYLERVAQGQENVVIPGKPLRLGLTSGTTGKQKMIVQSKARTLLFLFKYVPIGQRILRRSFIPEFSPLLKTCYFYTHVEPRYTSSRILMGPTTMLNLPDVLYHAQYSTPPCGMRLTSERQAIYVHLLFALRDPDLQALFAIFASNLYYAFKTLQGEWPRLVSDIHKGVISSHIELDPGVQKILEKELIPSPERAAELQAAFEEGFDDIARRIWPRLTSLWGVTSGSMTVYADLLRAKYTRDLPIVSMIYNSTEGLLGMLHGNAERTEYIALPTDIFYEFIPFDRSQEDQPQTLLASEVQAGECYEIVITNVDGLYRYRLGDVVKIAGFYNQAPIMQYEHRVGDVLSLKGELTMVTRIKEALKTSLAKFQDLLLVDYVCLDSSFYEQHKGHQQKKGFYYVVIAEVLEENRGKQLLPDVEKLASSVDASLCCLATSYGNCRSKGQLQPLRVLLVRPYTFGDFRSFIAEKSGASCMQIKIPKVLRNLDFVDFLLSKEVGVGAKTSR